MAGCVMADWAELPYDIIHKVASYLEAIEDFFAFSAVCCSWRSVYLTKQWCHGPQVPSLVLSHKEKSNITRFFSLYSNKICTLDLPATSGKRCIGTSSEWLLTIGRDLQMHLLNMFTGVTKSLPSRSLLDVLFVYFCDRYHMIDKALVVKKPCTSTTNKEELLVIAIFGSLKQFAFCRPGYSSWISVDTGGSLIFDIAYVNNQIFALYHVGTLVIIDVDDPRPPEVIHVMEIANCRWCWKQIFLVESSGDLWMVVKKPSDRSFAFHVVCFDVITREWIELRTLGNHAIFLGDNCSVSIHAPDRLNCKRNSIYFAVDKTDHLSYNRGCPVQHDLVVYNMTTKSAEPLCGVQDIPKYFSPFWVMPTLG